MVNGIFSVWKVLNHRAFFILFFVFLGAIYGTKADRHFGWTNKRSQNGEPIVADGAGYYAHLPQWFIYGKNNSQFLDSIGRKYPQSLFLDNIYIRYDTTSYSNKYYIGSAVAMTPFFAIAHIYASNSDGYYEADGYSRPYLVMVSIACIFYFLVGCLGIYFFLRAFAIGRFWIICSLSILAFGTNLGYYTYIITPYSHVFSFAATSWILFIAKRWSERHSLKWLLILAAVIGMAAIIRPTNMLVLVIIPFFFSSGHEFFLRLKNLVISYKWHFLAGLFVFGVFIWFQLWNVHVATGKWALNTYTNEGFDYLGNPKIMEVLFGFRKGFFIYCPVMLLIVPGWFLLFRINRRLFWASILFFILFTYVTASWWCWWYGGGLGMRSYIDIFPILILPIAFLFHYGRIWVKLIAGSLAIIGCWMGQVYEYQMKTNILHYSDITYEQFANVFMSKGLRYQWGMHMVYDHLPDSKPYSAEKLQFLMRKKAMPSGKFLKLFLENDKDNPIVTIYSRSADSTYYFGAKVKGEVFLYSEDTNPSFFVKYFKNGSIYRETGFFVGQFIPTTNELNPVEVEFYPNEQYALFDSVTIEFQEGNKYTGVKNFTIEQFRY